jgi:hypothetical protein
LVIRNTKPNKISESVNAYPSPKRATKYIDPNLISNLYNRNDGDLQREKDLKYLKNTLKESTLTELINHDTSHQQENKNLVAQNCKKHRVR